MNLTQKKLKSYFSSVDKKDRRETSVKISGGFNTYLVGRNGALCRHYYLRQKLVISTTGQHISITHATWEEGNLPDIKEFMELICTCNNCYLAALNGMDPRDENNQSFFFGDKQQELFNNQNREQIRR